MKKKKEILVSVESLLKKKSVKIERYLKKKFHLKFVTHKSHT